MTHRIEPFLLIWLTEWNPSFQFDSKNWILFKNITQRTEPFSTYDSKNWTLFNIWLEELNLFFSIELFQYDWKGLIFSICFEELNPFFGMTSRIDFFGKMSQIFEPFLLTDFRGIVVIGIVIEVVIGLIMLFRWTCQWVWIQCLHPELNQGPVDLQSAALTTGLCTLVQSSVLITIV